MCKYMNLKGNVMLNLRCKVKLKTAGEKQNSRASTELKEALMGF